MSDQQQTILSKTSDIETISLTSKNEEDSIDLNAKLRILKRQPEIGESDQHCFVEKNPLLTAEDYFEEFRANRDFIWLDILRAAVAEKELVKITRMNRKEFDEWRNTAIKMTFKAMLSVKEHCEFVIATRRNDVYMANFIGTLDENERKMYSQWQNKTIPTIPPFFNKMNLDKNEKAMFVNRCLRQDFDSLDYFMKVYGNYETIYGWWKQAIKSVQQTSYVAKENTV